MLLFIYFISGKLNETMWVYKNIKWVKHIEVTNFDKKKCKNKKVEFE